MIQDLSKTLQTVLTQPGVPPPLNNALISFDRPDEAFKPTQTTLNVFLYDLRENLELRSNELVVDKSNAQAVTRKPPLRLSCSYLITAWPSGGLSTALQEQLLLSQVLQVFGRFPQIPDALLQGTLAGQEPPLPMVTLHPDALKSLSEFWTSLGTTFRASVTVTVAISVPVFDDVVDFLVTSAVTTTAPSAHGVPDSSLQIGGRVLDQAAKPVAGALVDLLDAGLRTQTDDDGRFVLSDVPAGPHTLRVVAVGFQPLTQAVVAPGPPENYRVALTPL
jgi:hypothetical protein